MPVLLEKIKSNNIYLKLTLFLITISAESDFQQKQEYYCQGINGNIMNVPFWLSRHTIYISLDIKLKYIWEVHIDILLTCAFL